MFEGQNNIIYELVQEEPELEKGDLDTLKEQAERTGDSLAGVLVSEGIFSKEKLLNVIADYLGYRFLENYPNMVDGDTLALLDGTTARMYEAVPLGKTEEGSVECLVKDPFNYRVSDDLRIVFGKEVALVVGDPDGFDEFIKQCYGVEDESIDELLEAIGEGSELSKEDEISESALMDLATDTPIIRFVNLILQQAVRDKASDVHFEPYQDRFRVRYRIDGALYEMAPPPKSLALPVTSRLKVIANLNITERRVPQDGRIKIKISGRAVDLRISTLPTQYGESVVLRILDKSVVNLDLDALSMGEELLRDIREIIHRPNGIFIATGPTGSGKSTTLYSALREVNSIDTKILTAEDPVEYEMEGIIQVSMNHSVGLNFASALRSFLRQDPDKVMVGEIRDLETAQVAVQAALTGHMIFTTLHTNNAPSAVTRLVDLGLEPFLISASLQAILAQRLLRKICPSCKTAFTPSQVLIKELGLNPEESEQQKFYYGKGCQDCVNSGYKGRQGLFELMIISPSIRELIDQESPIPILQHKAVELGMKTLRNDGLRCIFNGSTTIEEVLKYT